MWSRPTTWPPNFEEGPQIFTLTILADIPFRIFSAQSLGVESGDMIIGSILGSFFGSLVYTLMIGKVWNIFFLRFSISILLGLLVDIETYSMPLNFEFSVASIFLFSKSVEVSSSLNMINFFALDLLRNFSDSVIWFKEVMTRRTVSVLLVRLLS